MALRNVLTVDAENDSLRKKSREIKVIDDKIRTLAEDMLETLYAQNGVGLAAPQIGVLKRLIIVDIGEGPITLLNPVIVYQKGEQEEMEGCLSVPGVWGIVKRPEKVIVRGETLEGKVIEVEGEGLLAIALCHEIDHLNGTLYTDKVIRYVDPSELSEEGKTN
ncbi:MAG: peptide deformylase [Ruminococcaceae bacterium]|nr:peptide deformylase [Oscillospiraceae bacterium]